MKQSKHTPAPWIYREQIIMSEKTKAVIARVHKFDNTLNDPKLPAEANANLIAAAPELLEALEMVLDVVADCHDCWELNASEDKIKFVQNTIAKARGENG